MKLKSVLTVFFLDPISGSRGKLNDQAQSGDEEKSKRLLRHTSESNTAVTPLS